MSLLSLQDLTIGFRGPLLLDGVHCQIQRGQKIGLLGRNGAGKSTLMKILCGQLEPDHGEVVLAPMAKVAFLQQDVPRDMQGEIQSVVAEGAPPDPDDPDSIWRCERQVEQILSRMQLDGGAKCETLSSGMKRRVLLAQALAAEPDLLLLDEPTNHLDIEAIDWMEQFLTKWNGTLMFVTHDRMFLQKLANRIIELDRGQLFDWSCDYQTFLQRKEAALAAEEKQNALFDKRLAEEEVWIRQGIKARRTRNEGRVRALKSLREERQQRISQTGQVKLQLHQELRSGTIVAHLEKVSFSYEDKTIFENFSALVQRGDKVGVIGPNGAGKTTLLRVMLGQLTPDSGEVRLGANLQIAYFDQLRQQLREDQTVVENVGDGYDTIQVGGGSKHILGYLQDFLFTPERARTEVRYLSGGERNRILLAKLFAKPANVVVLDEPTNDLDAETLDLLEELLSQYEGTVLVVSHDRAFLNNVVTSTIVFEDGQAKEYAGGYDDWLNQRPKKTPPKPEKKAPRKQAPKPPSNRLSFKEKQELAHLPGRIEKLEAQIAEAHEKMAAPDFYKRDGEEIAQQTTALSQWESELSEAYARWESLEERSG